MTSATTEARRTHGRRVEGHGLIVFSSVLLVILGIFNVIYGIAAIANSHVFDQMFFIPAYPFWSLVIIAVDVVALYGLCAYGSRENLTA